MSKLPVCAVVGIGPGNGAAFARRFTADGFAVALIARSPSLSQQLAQELPHARAYECDVGDAASVSRTFEAIRADLGDPEVVVFNAGSGTFGTFELAEIKWSPRPPPAYGVKRLS